MGHIYADLVLESTTSTGMTLTLAGAPTGYRTFSAAVGAGNTCYYSLEASNGEKETGLGTVGTGTLERTTLIASSTGSFLSLPAGTHYVGVTANSAALQPLAIADGPAANTTLAVNTIYRVNMSAWTVPYTYTLPATFAVGDEIVVLCTGSRVDPDAWLDIVPASGDTVDYGALGLVLTIGDAFGVEGSTANAAWKLTRLQLGVGVSGQAGNLLALGTDLLPYASATQITPAAIGAATAAKGVTGGDSHDHNGGDGAQIAYSSLSGAPTIPSASDATPAALGTAAAGTEAAFSRADHVHTMPGAANVGAEPALGNPGTTGYVLSSTDAGVRSWAPQSGSLADGSVTLAKLANLAQDQFIGRVTASTGAPETATVTAAARTVLDDTTVGAMVNTLGGATATGTGGLARATSPTLVTPILSSPQLRDAGELVKAHGTLSGNATIDLKDGHVHTITTDAARTLTLENTTEHTAGSLTVLLTKSAHTITWAGDFSNTTGWIGTPPDISAADTYIIFFHWLGTQNVCYAVYGGTN